MDLTGPKMKVSRTAFLLEELGHNLLPRLVQLLRLPRPWAHDQHLPGHRHLLESSRLRRSTVSASLERTLVTGSLPDNPG